MEDLNFKLNHIALLFKIDQDLKGRITLQNLKEFALFSHEVTKLNEKYEYQNLI